MNIMSRSAINALLLACVPTFAMATPAGFHRAEAGHLVAEFRVPASDATELQTLVYLPGEGSGPWPTLVTRSPYDLPLTPVSGFPEDHANAEIEADEKDIGWTEATDRGYALVIQFVRGRNESDGTFSLFLDERADGDALLRWIEEQPWSNGRLGVFGDSAGGVAALQAAATGRASVRAIYAQATSPDFLGGVIFPDRSTKWEALLPFVLSQSLENSEDHESRLGIDEESLDDLKGMAIEALGDMFGALEDGDASASEWWSLTPTEDFPVVSDLQPRWGDLLAARTDPRALQAGDVTRRLRAPMLQVGLWHDFFHDSAMDAWARRGAAGRNDRLIMLDGTHYDVDDPELWPIRPMFTWFDYWLKGTENEVAQWPKVQFTWAGEGAASIIGSPRWPLVTRTRVAELQAPSAAIPVDPTRPVPTLGGNHLIAPAGMLDQSPLLARPDVGLLLGSPLSAALPIVGEVEASIRLRRGYRGPLVAKLVDVRPDGEIRLLSESLIGEARGRRISVRFSPIAYRFDAGSTPALMIAGSSFPAWVFENSASGLIDIGSAQLALPDASACGCSVSPVMAALLGTQPPACELVASSAPGAVCRAP
jgi:putative CocE/NonD family hydrolase